MAESEDPKPRPLNIDDDGAQFPLDKFTRRRQSHGPSYQPNASEQVGRIPPQAVDVEQAVLGAMLLEPEAIPQAIEVLRSDAFYQLKHQKIYIAMLNLFERGNPVDLITLTEELKTREELEQVGGAYYLAELTAQVASAANVEYHARIIAEKSLMRKMIETMTKLIGRAYDPSTDAFDLLDHAERDIFEISESQLRKSSRSMSDVLKETLKRLEAIHGQAGGITGVPSGFTRLDDMTGGWQNSDLVIIAARPSMGKCLSKDAEILCADGSVETIESLFHRGQADLLTLTNDWTFRLTQPSAFVDDGIKPVFRVTTRLGRTIETTLTHPFLTINGWKPLGQIHPGDHVAVPRQLDVFGTDHLPDAQIKLLAYLIGDGGLTDTCPEFTNRNPRLRADFRDALANFGGLEATLETSTGTRTAHHKFVPKALFRLPKPGTALFLNRLFACDGWASVLKSGQSQLGYSTASERLARQVQHLLLRFGIMGRLKKRQVKYKNGRRPQWQLDVTDARSIQTFIDEIGIFGKETALLHVANALTKRRYQTNRDLIPVGVWPQLLAAKGQESWQALGKRAGMPGYSNLHVGKRALTRQRLLTLAQALSHLRLQQLARSAVYWDEIVSIEPMGLKQVYDLTIPETHNFVANDICVHNTAFSLSVARNAALHQDPEKQTPIAIFSLEMSASQLAQRLLTAEARIDAQSARTGRLKDEDWPNLARAAGRLSAAKIFIDDTPALGVLELRAKCRRLKAEHNIGLVVVDYLQLMHGPKGGRAQNREQEIAAISRALKSLAKELDVPVLALSQLSRAVETRGGDKRPMLSDLRESGCLTGDTLIPLSDSGQRVPIRELVGQSGFNIWALNGQSLKLEAAPISRAFCTGRKQVYRIKTRLGRTIRATANHKFLTIDGWKRLDELSSNEHLALPRSIPASSTQTITNDELALLGHLIGDGCTLPRHAVQYTTVDADLAETVLQLANRVFGEALRPRIKKERSWFQVYLPATRKLTHGVYNPIRSWFSDLGIWGLRSHEKHIPERVFSQPSSAISVFLRHLWATDGCARMRTSGGRPYPAIYYATSSPPLANDVQSLLLRLKINARIKQVPQKGKGRDQYHVIISGHADLSRFVENIGAVGARKIEVLSQIQAFLSGNSPNTNRDVIPKAAWMKWVVPAMQAAHLSQRAMQAQLGMSYCGTTLFKSNLSRSRAQRVATVVQSLRLQQMAESDLYWDQIKTITEDGIEEVYDLTVPGLHNFIANDLVVHNSIEQDADVVMFIYRAERYGITVDENGNSTEGIGEIIIGKQRNGPIGNVQLAFVNQYARFENLTTYYASPDSGGGYGDQDPTGDGFDSPPPSSLPDAPF